MMGRKSETRGGDLIQSAGTAKTLLQEYRERNPFRLNSTYVPDAVTDTSRRRDLKAARWEGDGCGVAARLYVACDGEFQLVTLVLGKLELYSPQTYASARDFVDILVKGKPYMAKLECSRNGEVHAHVVLSAHAILSRGFGKRLHSKPVTDFRGLLRYLAKPMDARACRLRNHEIGPFIEGLVDKREIATRLKEVEQEGREIAAEEYLAAREKYGRLSPMTWWGNIPHTLAFVAEVAAPSLEIERLPTHTPLEPLPLPMVAFMLCLLESNRSRPHRLPHHPRGRLKGKPMVSRPHRIFSSRQVVAQPNAPP